MVPGQTLSEADVRPGLGAYAHSGEVVAATLGIKNVDGTYASVIPLGGQYIPRVGDVVIGRITDVGPSNWLIEINSPYPAPMHVNEVPWHVEFGETTDFLKAGDTVIVRVVKVTEVGRVQVSMEGPGLRKLSGGQLIDVPHSKVPRVIGTRGSMISLIKKYTACRLVVGQNGRIWIDGQPDDILIAMGAIKMVSEQAHTHGLTDKVREYLKATKGVDIEAEEEAQRAKDEEQRAKDREQRAKEQERMAKKSPEDKESRTGRAQVDKRDRGRRKEERPAKVGKRKAKEEVDTEDEYDEHYDGFEDDQLCNDPSSGGNGLVTVLSPDGESLMVVEEEDLPPCEPDKGTKKTKEDN